MKLSYEELRRIYRLEKNTSNLVEVPEDFFSLLNEFIKEGKKNYMDSLQKDFSESSARDFNNLKKIVRELFSLRQKKLLNKALISSHTKEVSELHMAKQEKDIYRNLIKILNNYNSLMDEIFNGEVKDTVNKTSATSKKENLNELKVIFNSDVPSFVGSDMKEYGPFKKDEKTVLPYKVAKLLISREVAILQ